MFVGVCHVLPLTTAIACGKRALGRAPVPRSCTQRPFPIRAGESPQWLAAVCHLRSRQQSQVSTAISGNRTRPVALTGCERIGGLRNPRAQPQRETMNDASAAYEIVTEEADFRALQSEWDELWVRSRGWYYQSFGHCWLAWDQIAKPLGRRLRIVVRREAGTAVLIFPLITYRRALWIYLAP